MKTTDSVMRERLEGMKQWTFHYTYECPKCGAFYGKDDTYCTNDRTKIVKKETKYAETLQEPYNQAIDDTLTLLSHSLAEARREERERILEAIQPAVDDFMAGANTLVDKGYPNIAREMRENIQFVVLAIKDKTDLLTGDNPEEAK